MARELKPLEAVGVNDPDVLRETLLGTGTAEVVLEGLDEKEQGQAKALLYSIAKRAGRTVKVRTDKTRNVAVGVLKIEVAPDLVSSAHVPDPSNLTPADIPLDLAALGISPEAVIYIGEDEPLTFTPVLPARLLPVDTGGRFIQPGHGQHAVGHPRYDANDYFRWAWGVRHVTPTTRLLHLESGSGTDFAYFLNHHQALPQSMVVVETFKIPRHAYPEWLTVYDGYDVASATPDAEGGRTAAGALVELHGQFNLISCTNQVDPVVELLGACKALLAPDGYVMLKVVVPDGQTQEMQEAVAAAGFRVANRWGVFGDYDVIRKGIEDYYLSLYGALTTSDVIQTMAAGTVAFFDGLRAFYPDDILAGLLAPLMPNHSADGIWMLVHDTPF